MSVPANQPRNASITAAVTRRANPQNKTITLRNFVTVKALISMMTAITIQSHPTKRKTVRNALGKGAPRFEALTAVETFG
jgi:hypothetical protein